MKYTKVKKEEALKNKIASDYFKKFDCTDIIGNIDFCVKISETSKECSDIDMEFLLWAEAKKSSTADIYASFVQLILTIGKERPYNTYMPPPYLGAFDSEKFAFISYNDIHEIFSQNDFNWKVAPSNHKTKEFMQIYDKVKKTIESNSMLFRFDKDDKELKSFIKENIIRGKVEPSKIKIDKNNFALIYIKWLEIVKPTIAVVWNVAKSHGIIDGDFYLADLLSRENISFKDKLFVLLKTDHYEMDKKIDDMGLFSTKTTSFMDEQKAHIQFWNKYERPPQEEYWDYIVNSRHLLVPQDVRRRKGSFFTPIEWVELSQKYLADVFGDNWQEEYYIWDCAAGTGNLLEGLTNKFNIYASTIDKQDVDIMKDRIDNGANLLDSHVFQFDFLNDSFNQLPKSLQEIISDKNKRKKLIIYINPPYAEAVNFMQDTIPQVATETKIFSKYHNLVAKESLNELFAQFFIRIYKEIPDSHLATFSTPKYITSEKFKKFRNTFLAEYKKGFVCRSDTFDNVTGKFPITFLIWNLSKKNKIDSIETDIYLNDNDLKNIWVGGKKSFSIVDGKSIAIWRKTFYCNDAEPIGYMIIVGPSMQSNNNTFITNKPVKSYVDKGMAARITKNNLIEMSIYYSVRHSIELTWINNRDMYHFPNDAWKTDVIFQSDCLTFTLFHGQNNVSSRNGINYWIPFKEMDIDASEKFNNSFIADFIAGKNKKNSSIDLLGNRNSSCDFSFQLSKESEAVFLSGKALWKYYHKVKNCNVNASFYDIREYYQGRSANGSMNNKSDDEKYNFLITDLRDKIKILAKKIQPKIYEFGFLKR